jgi:hypothetical protein
MNCNPKSVHRYVAYQFLNLQFSIGAERGDRSSNLVGGGYDYTLYSANARLRF